MECLVTQPKQEYAKDHVDFSALAAQMVKQEPLDDPQTNIFDYQNQNKIIENYNLSTSYSWSMLVSQCRYLLQEEYEFNQMNSTLMTKIIVKEANDLLRNIVKFFQDCCNPLDQEEVCSENSVEVDGLLVNILPHRVLIEGIKRI